MSACEKCWADAYLVSRETGKTQAECYQELLEKRKDNPCTLAQQRGDWCFRHHVELDQKHECYFCVTEDESAEGKETP